MHNVSAQDKPYFKVKQRLNEKIVYEDSYEKIIAFKTTEGYVTVEQYRHTIYQSFHEGENWNLVLQAAYKDEIPIEIFQYHENMITTHFKNNLKTNYKSVMRLKHYEVAKLTTSFKFPEYYKETFLFDDKNNVIEYQNQYGDVWNTSMPFDCPYDPPVVEGYMVPCTHLCPYLMDYI